MTKLFLQDPRIHVIIKIQIKSVVILNKCYLTSNNKKINACINFLFLHSTCSFPSCIDYAKYKSYIVSMFCVFVHICQLILHVSLSLSSMITMQLFMFICCDYNPRNLFTQSQLQTQILKISQLCSTSKTKAQIKI